MTEKVIALKKTKGTPSKCSDCGMYTGTKGTVSRDPRYCELDSKRRVCTDCAHNYPWDEEVMREGGVTFREVPFTPDPDINIDQVVEPGFIKAMKYSHYTKLAYKLGFEKGKNDE